MKLTLSDIQTSDFAKHFHRQPSSNKELQQFRLDILGIVKNSIQATVMIVTMMAVARSEATLLADVLEDIDITYGEH